MRAVIICGGTVEDYILDYIKDTDYVICADSGYDRAKKFSIEPNIIIGDMDSVKTDLGDNQSIVYPAKKDFTDSELALFHAIEKGADQILMFGMIGTRMDHTYANLSLLLNCKDIGAVIIDGNNIIRMVFDQLTLHGEIGDTVSILPFAGDVHGVSTSGLEYPLENSTIKIGTSLGVSNKMTNPQCCITVKKGTALVIRSND